MWNIHRDVNTVMHMHCSTRGVCVRVCRVSCVCVHGCVSMYMRGASQDCGPDVICYSV